MTNHALIAGISAIAFMACAVPAAAQQTPAPAPDPAVPDATAQAATDDDIIVTASKTGAQVLSKVPMAIQAFSGEVLKARQVNEAADLMNLIPGASQQSQVGAAFRVFSFRGSGAGGSVGDGMIGYYLDDTPFGIPISRTPRRCAMSIWSAWRCCAGRRGRCMGPDRWAARSSSTPRTPTFPKPGSRARRE